MSGATLGLAWVHPSFALTAWLSPALLVVALSRTRALPMAFAGWWAADALRGIAAVHVGDALTLPHRAPPDEAIDLVIWPEAARHLRPYLGEGPGRGMHIEPLLPDSAADHLIGLVTRHPLKGLMNQAVAVDARGTVITSRAKRHFMPVSERRWMGLIGRDAYVRGRLPTLMTLGPRSLIPLICGELLSRRLIAEGAALEGEVMIVAARDQMMVTDRALRHLLAVQVMRSVEYGVPSVRSSLGGWASFVSSDGRVLALRGRDRNGLLMWDPERGARDVDFFGRAIDGPPPPAPPPSVAVLYSESSPSHRTPCPEGRCTYHALEGFTCGASRADTVIVAGHGRPPEYLSHAPADVAAAIGCFAPDLVVIDACYGASSTLFSALGDLRATVVAAASLVPTAGLRYGAGFFSDAPVEQRAAALALPEGELTRWRIDQATLTARLAAVNGMGPDALRAHLKRRDPPHVRVPLGEAGPIMVPVAWDQVASGAPVAPERRRRRRPR